MASDPHAPGCRSCRRAGRALHSGWPRPRRLLISQSCSIRTPLNPCSVLLARFSSTVPWLGEMVSSSACSSASGGSPGASPCRRRSWCR